MLDIRDRHVMTPICGGRGAGRAPDSCLSERAAVRPCRIRPAAAARRNAPIVTAAAIAAAVFIAALGCGGKRGGRISDCRPAVRVEEGRVRLEACAADPDGDRIAFRWRQIGGPPVRLSDPTARDPYFVPVEAGQYEFEVVASDGRAESAPARVRVPVYRPNAPPKADAGRDIEVEAGQFAFLTAANSFDPDGDPLRYEWRQIEGPRLHISRTERESKDVRIKPAAPGKYVFELRVGDGKCWSEPARVAVRVLPHNFPPLVKGPPDASVELPVPRGASGAAALPDSGNRPPVVAVAPGGTVAPGREIVLDGSGTSDPDGDLLEFWWEQVSGPPVRMLKGKPDSPVWTCRLQQTGNYVFRMRASDGRREAVSGPVTFTVASGNLPPKADAGRDIIAEAGKPVRLDGSRSKDPDGDALTYRWRQIEGPRVRDWIYEDMGRPERPAFVPREPGEYAFELVVSDGKENSEPAVVRVSVLPPNRPPSVRCDRAVRVPVGQPVRIRAEGEDPDGNALWYRWRMLEGPALPKLPPDAWNRKDLEFVPNAPGLYLFEVTASDGRLESIPARCQLGVDRHNTPPTAHISGPSRAKTGEEAVLDGRLSCDPDGDALTYRWSQISGPNLELVPSGPILTVRPPEPGEYVFGLVVEDGRDRSRQATFMLRVAGRDRTEDEKPGAEINGGERRPPGER